MFNVYGNHINRCNYQWSLEGIIEKPDGKLYILQDGVLKLIKSGETILALGYSLDNIRVDDNNDTIGVEEFKWESKKKKSSETFQGCPCQSSFSNDLTNEKS